MQKNHPIIGVPVIENCKRGMKKQVGKSQLFTKESLTKNFANYSLIMFAMAKIMEMNEAQQNQVALFLFNCI